MTEERGLDWRKIAFDLADELGPCSRVCPNVFMEDCTECWIEWAARNYPRAVRPNLEDLHKEDKHD
jgi:hypothetical protein